jgi:hypothetical protein
MYLFYLDESGEREYESHAKYFVLCALGVPVQEWKTLNTEILTLKKTYFNDVDVEIKSNWLRRPNERDARYLRPYRITQEELQEFTTKVYEALLSRDVTTIAAIVDKPAMKQRYRVPQSSSSVTYRFVIERIERFLEGQWHDYGILIFDKITELELKKKGYENLLTRQHLRYLEKGTDYVPVSQIVEGLLFIPSHENNLLQLADLCAYNVYRQFVMHGEEWDKRQRFSNHYDYFSLIEPKLYRSPKGDYRGWGIKKFP